MSLVPVMLALAPSPLPSHHLHRLLHLPLLPLDPYTTGTDLDPEPDPIPVLGETAVMVVPLLQHLLLLLPLLLPVVEVEVEPVLLKASALYTGLTSLRSSGARLSRWPVVILTVYDLADVCLIFDLYLFLFLGNESNALWGLLLEFWFLLSGV